jgi:hypothetical protein
MAGYTKGKPGAIWRDPILLFRPGSNSYLQSGGIVEILAIARKLKINVQNRGVHSSRLSEK